MKKNVCIFAASFFALCSVTFSQQAAETKNDVKKEEIPPMILTIEQAVEYANAHSRTLKAAQIDLEMKERASKYGWNKALPTVTAAGVASRSNENNPLQPPGYTKKFDKEKDRWSVVGDLSASITLNIATIERIRQAHASFEAGKITWQQTVRETELNVRKLFYGLLLQQETLRVQKVTLENSRQRARQAEISYRNGQSSEINMLQAQVAYENKRPDIDKMQQQLEQQLDNFAFIIGLPVGTKIQIDGKIEPEFMDLNAEELFAKYGENNYDVASLKKNIDVLKIQLKATDFQSFTPSLTLGWNTQPIVENVGKMWFDPDNVLYDSGKLDITLSWVLSDMLPFSANRQSAKDIKDNIRKLNVQLDTTRQNNELTVNKTVDSLTQARNSIEANQRNTTLAQRSYDMTAIAYRSGTMELLDLRDAENQLNQAKLGVLNEQYNYLSYLLDLEYTLNTRLIGGNK